MRRAEAGAGVAVEVLVEGDQVVPGRVLLEEAVAAEDGARAVVALQKECGEAAGELVGYLCQAQLAARAGRALDRERVPEVAVVDPERLDEQVVDRHPDWRALPPKRPLVDSPGS